MALTPTLQRATALGTQLALAPWRLLGPLAGPVRRDIADDMRRAIGLRGEPAPPVTDPEAAFLDPDGVADRCTPTSGHAHRRRRRAAPPDAAPPGYGGGRRALPLQGGPDGTPAAHRDVRRRDHLRSKEEARRSIAAVKRVHRRVHGIAPDGRPYSASDPDLVTWVHVHRGLQLPAGRRSSTVHRRFTRQIATSTSRRCRRSPPSWCQLGTAERGGCGGLSAPDPPELYAGVQALTARDFLLRGVAQRLEDRAVYAVIVGAAIGLLPGWARRELPLAEPAPPRLARGDALGHDVVHGAVRWVRHRAPRAQGGRELGESYATIVMPPSTAMTWPVT